MKFLLMLIMLASCAVDPASSSIEEDISKPDYVCGLPTQCQPWECAVHDNGIDVWVTCDRVVFSDFACALSCGNFDAECPSNQSEGSCHRRCDNASFDPAYNANCFSSCMNSFTTSCQVISPL